MLIKSVEQITKISDNNDINSQNYLESISYINNLYDVINMLKSVISFSDTVFEPTFKGRYTCSKYNIPSTEKENDLKFFILKTSEFLEDYNDVKKELLFDILNGKCEPDSIVLDEEYIQFTLL